MKRPASQYYWGDWRRDTALQACSIAARGLWHEMNCLMHDCEPYGHLMVGAAPMRPAQLARLVGITPKECAALVAELEAAGIFSRANSGAIFSRRMVRDEDIRERRANGGHAGAAHGAKGAAHGAKGGRPKAGEGGEKTPLPPDKQPPPAFASASAIPSIQVGADSTTVGAGGDLPTDPPGSPGGEDPPPDRDDPPPPSPSVAGRACLLCRGANVHDVNPSHPDLLRLLDAGVTPEDIGDTAAEIVKAGKPARFAYVLRTVESRRREAAQRGAVPAASPAATVPGEPTAAYVARQRAEAEKRAAEDSGRQTPESIAIRREAAAKLREVTASLTRTA